MLFILPKILTRKSMSNRTYKRIKKLNISISIQTRMINRHLAIINQWKNSPKIINKAAKS